MHKEYKDKDKKSSFKAVNVHHTSPSPLVYRVCKINVAAKEWKGEKIEDKEDPYENPLYLGSPADVRPKVAVADRPSNTMRVQAAQKAQP
jgi:hypothetical protein